MGIKRSLLVLPLSWNNRKGDEYKNVETKFVSEFGKEWVFYHGHPIAFYDIGIILREIIRCEDEKYPNGEGGNYTRKYIAKIMYEYDKTVLQHTKSLSGKNEEYKNKRGEIINGLCRRYCCKSLMVTYIDIVHHIKG